MIDSAAARPWASRESRDGRRAGRHPHRRCRGNGPGGRRLRPQPGGRRGPVLDRQPPDPARHHRAPAGPAARAGPHRPGRTHLRADRGRRRRDLALRRRRGLLRLRERLAGRRRRARRPAVADRRGALPARAPARRRRGPRPLSHDLPGLVQRAYAAHPPEGPRRRRRRAHRAAVLPRVRDAAVYRRAPYRSHGRPDTSHAADRIYAQAGRSRATLRIARRRHGRKGHRGTIALGVAT